MDQTFTPKMVVERVKLPSRGIVTKGYLGKNEDESLAIGDTFHLLTSKKEEVIECMDRHERTLLLPCSTKNRFFKLKDSTSADDVDAGEVHADYTTIYSLDELLRAFQLPISVRMVSTDTATRLVPGSSAFALLLQRQILTEYLVLATEEMHLVTVPIDLDIEVKLLRPTVARPPARHTPDLVVGGGEGQRPMYNATVPTQEEYGLLDESSRQRLTSDDEDLYESLIDYQEVRTLGGASSERLGNYATLRHAREQPDVDKTNTLRKKLKMAKTHLLTSQERQESGSPIIEYWEREVKSIESALRSAEPAPAIPQRRSSSSTAASPAVQRARSPGGAVSPPPGAEPGVYKTFGDTTPSSPPPTSYQAVHTFAHSPSDGDGQYSLALKVNSSTMIPADPGPFAAEQAGGRAVASAASSVKQHTKTTRGSAGSSSAAAAAPGLRGAVDSPSAEAPRRHGSGSTPGGAVRGPPSPAEFERQKQQFLYAQKKAFQKAHGTGKSGGRKGSASAPPSSHAQQLRQRTPRPADIGARVTVVGYNCFGTLRYMGPAPGSGQPCCGVELDNPDGLHNGTVNGHAVFSCAPKHGVVVHPRKVLVLPSVAKPKGDGGDGSATAREVVHGEEITYKTIAEKEADEGANPAFYLESGTAAAGQPHQYSSDGEYAFATDQTDQVVPQLPTKDEVAAMDTRGIFLLLKTLGLQHLQKSFADNAITGKMFVELDETMLVEELSVTKKFDRLKILQFQ
eukprot:m.1108215 g.1108215  ORF g.1108215 m.1108215 type:complete len:740 (+) comp24351_c0_seq20:284-2503(+)